LQRLGQDSQAAAEFTTTQELYRYYAEGSVAIGQCRALLIQRQPDAAWVRCEPSLQTDDVDKLTAIGILFGNAGDYAHALTVWQRAVDLDPDAPELQHNLAFTFFQLKDLLNARIHAAKALELWPDFADATILYGTILYMLREDRDAELVLAKAHQLRPADAGVDQLLADLRAHTNRNH
jgi:Flp pilus assembly protein TadD